MIRTFQQFKVEIIDNPGSKYGSAKVSDMVRDRITSKEVLELLQLEPDNSSLRRYLSKTPNLDNDIIRNNIELFDICSVLNHTTIKCDALLTSLFINGEYSRLICKIQKLSKEFVDKYKDKLSFWLLSQNENIEEEILDKYSDQDLDWFIVSYRKLSDNFIIKHLDKLNIGVLIINNFETLAKLSIEVESYVDRKNRVDNIKDYKNELYIEEVILGKRPKCGIATDDISKEFKLSKYIIDTYSDKLNMELVNKYQKTN